MLKNTDVVVPSLHRLTPLGLFQVSDKPMGLGGGNIPTEYKLIQGVDAVSTGYESFKDSLNRTDNLNLDLDSLVGTPLAQYAQSEMGKYDYCQKQPNARACIDSINNPKPAPTKGVIAVSAGGDVTPVKGKAATSAIYLSKDDNGVLLGSSGTTANTVGFGGSVGIGVDYYYNLNSFFGHSRTYETCFIVGCYRFHKDERGKQTIGYGFGILTETGSGFTYFEGNTIPYHKPILLNKGDKNE